MPNTVATTKVCLFTQQMMDDILGRNDPNRKKRQTLGFTNALNSPQNTNGFEAIQTGVARPTPTSARVLSVYYRNPAICDAVEQGEPKVCDEVPEATYPYEDQLVFVENYNHVPITLSRSTYQSACEGLNEELARKTIDAAYQLLKAENDFFIKEYLDNLCVYANGLDSTPGSGTEQIIKMFNDIGQPNAMSFFKMRDNYNLLGYVDDNPIVVGGSGVSAWAFSQSIFQDNLDGLDTTRMPFQFPTFIDYQYDAIINEPVTRRLASWMPGSIQRLEWLKFQEGSEYRIAQEQITKTTIVVDGQTFDYSINNDGCNDFVTVTVGRGYDLFIPDAPVYDPLSSDCDRGACPRLNWIADCADLDCSDTIQTDIYPAP